MKETQTQRTGSDPSILCVYYWHNDTNAGANVWTDLKITHVATWPSYGLFTLMDSEYHNEIIFMSSYIFNKKMRKNRLSDFASK